MAAPATTDEMLALVRRSGLVPAAKLDAFLQALADSEGLPDDPRRCCGLMIRERLLTFFQAEQLLQGKWRGFGIGKYGILERIGIGGMGQVFLCQHLHMRRRVAVKVLPPLKAQDPSALGRFYREGRASASLDHPNIVRAHDLDQDGSLHFLVMEYVDGSSLLDVVKRTGAMVPGRAANYIAQAARGLQHAYEQGIIHRDVKPGNLMVDRAGTVKILDMGLARFYHDTSDMLTQKFDEKSVLGTADYVAPEQTADSHGVDVRADVYGLGATFYFMLAGHPPYPDGTVAQKLLFHQTRPVRPIRELRPEVPPEMADVVHKMLAKNPNDRYQTPADVAEALAAWASASVPQPPAEEMPQLSPLATADMSGSMPLPELPKAPIKDSGLVRPELMPPRPTPAQRQLRVPSLADFNVTPTPGAVRPGTAAATVATATPLAAPPRPVADDTDNQLAAHQDTPAAPRPAALPAFLQPSFAELEANLDRPERSSKGLVLLGLVAALGGCLGWLLYLNVRL